MSYSTRRGTIQYRARAQQIVDFCHLRYAFGITPTDVDGLLELRDKAWIAFEIKHARGDEQPPVDKGQGIALKRLIDDLSATGKPCCLVFAKHYVDDCSEDINAAETVVFSAYEDGKWYSPTKPITLREYVDDFLRRSGLGHLIEQEGFYGYQHRKVI